MANSKLNHIKTRSYDSGFALLFALGALILLGSVTLLVQAISVQSSLSTKKLSTEIRSDVLRSSQIELVKPFALEVLLQQDGERKEKSVHLRDGFIATVATKPNSKVVSIDLRPHTQL